ncbi:hypothetical protein HYPSUDRAFT_206464 [Hypholoma sublateritium FD-334 SS-4]|uniref:Uncharacterized protein n=1 Tax=Hypholoma sublateritium (strain FD-334 SS-4) TaxID=945553 RepID=A0A0D2M1T1_HYPSF|nr:hypothetical protein HYPSUDRAFT_206464 [Hypholoma sublateritium FD-334 SS-4]
MPRRPESITCTPDESRFCTASPAPFLSVSFPHSLSIGRSHPSSRTLLPWPSPLPRHATAPSPAQAVRNLTGEHTHARLARNACTPDPHRTHMHAHTRAPWIAAPPTAAAHNDAVIHTARGAYVCPVSWISGDCCTTQRRWVRSDLFPLLCRPSARFSGSTALLAPRLRLHRLHNPISYSLARLRCVYACPSPHPAPLRSI